MRTYLLDDEARELMEGLPALCAVADRRDAWRRLRLRLDIDELELEPATMQTFEAWACGQLTKDDAIASLLRYT